MDEQISKDPLVGGILGDYQIVERLGAGAMGVVYKAINTGLGRWVALKLLAPERVSEPGFLERFHREARTAGQLQHPNIVSIYHVGHAEDHHFIEMEFVEGENLRSIINRDAPMEIKRAMEIIRQVAMALVAAHERQLAHRDIKPDNILICADGSVKVADFGLAKNLADNSMLTKAGQAVGTPRYMAPEQFDGTNTDLRSDFYSLGVTFYYMLTARPPFEGDNVLELMQSHKRRKPISADILNPAVPKPVCHLIARLLEKEPESRPANAEQLLAEFDVLMAPRKERARARLLRFVGHGKVKVIAMDGPEFAVGRGRGNDLAVRDQRTSKHHARFFFEGDALLVEDLNSRNGTRVNGEPVARMCLKEGDLVSIGLVPLLVLRAPPARPRESAAPAEKFPDGRLIGVRGPAKGKVFVVRQRPEILGKGKHATLKLDDPGLSARHVHLCASAEGVWIQDLRSETGTHVGGVRVRRKLLRGDESVELGESHFRFELAVTTLREEEAMNAPDAAPAAESYAPTVERPPPVSAGIPPTEQSEPVADGPKPEAKSPFSIPETDQSPVFPPEDALGPKTLKSSAVVAESSFEADTPDGEEDQGLGTVAAGVSPSSPQGVFRITFVEGPLSGRSFEIGGDALVIGREPGAHVSIDDVALSRRHARIRGIDGGIEIEDLDSRNGIEVNGAGTRRQLLKSGDTVRLGASLFVVHGD